VPAVADPAAYHGCLCRPRIQPTKKGSPVNLRGKVSISSYWMVLTAGVPPPGVIPNWANTPSNGYVLIVVGTIVMYVAAVLRFYTRIFIRDKMAADDCKHFSPRKSLLRD
jgi:hypothetical protein